MGELPTVALVDEAFYWIKPAYGDNADRWTVARWHVGSFWGVDGREIRPSVISGPIPGPAQGDVGSANPKTEE